MTVRLEDPEARLQHARDVAWKALNRRERTVAELARLLAAKRVEPAAIETVVARAARAGLPRRRELRPALRRGPPAAGRVGRRADRAQAALARDRPRADRGRDRRAGPRGRARGGAGAPRAPLPRAAADAARARPGARRARPQGLRARARPRRAAPPRAACATSCSTDAAAGALRRRLVASLRRRARGTTIRQATDRAAHGLENTSKSSLSQSGTCSFRRDGDPRHLLRARTLESQAGGPGHTDPTAHLAAI